MTKDKLEKKLKNNEIIPISLQKFKKKVNRLGKKHKGAPFLLVVYAECFLHVKGKHLSKYNPLTLPLNFSHPYIDRDTK